MSIEESNKLISAFMGYEFVTVRYFDCEDETEWQRNNRDWIDKVGLESVGDYVVKVKEDIWQEFEYVKYHESWDQLMPVWKKAAEILWDIRGDLNDNKYIEAHRITKAFITACQKVEIKAAYTSVIAAIEFIQWYNTLNSKS